MAMIIAAPAAGPSICVGSKHQERKLLVADLREVAQAFARLSRAPSQHVALANLQDSRDTRLGPLRFYGHGGTSIAFALVGSVRRFCRHPPAWNRARSHCLASTRVALGFHF